MRRQAQDWLLLLALCAALCACWFWALRPILTPVFRIHPMDWTESHLIREIWHFRLVPPEWASNPPSYLRWAAAETHARLGLVLIAWVSINWILIPRILRSRKTAVAVPVSQGSPQQTA